MTEKEQIVSSIFERLGQGETTIEELNTLVCVFEGRYKESGKSELAFIEWHAYSELLRRLSSSVFLECSDNYPESFKKYCIKGEYQNTLLIIDLINRIMAIGKELGDIASPSFYGQPDPGYKITKETLIHILLRHNNTINNFINPDSKSNGHNPSSFGFGALAEPMLTLFMALNAISDSDWKKSERGKNLIFHFKNCNKNYTIIRKGESKEILSFYPRNDDHDAEFIELERLTDKMAFTKKLTVKRHIKHLVEYANIKGVALKK